MRIYTKTGDAGSTGLLGGARVMKTSPRIEAIGDCDELNSILGLVRTANAFPELEIPLEKIQNLLFDLGAELASDPEGSFTYEAISPEHVAYLEAWMDAATESLPPLKQFILPGGTEVAARLHHARTVCRRAERRVLELHEIEPVREEARVFLNRLSDWLFLAARKANALGGSPDVPWKRAEV